MSRFDPLNRAPVSKRVWPLWTITGFNALMFSFVSWRRPDLYPLWWVGFWFGMFLGATAFRVTVDDDAPAPAIRKLAWQCFGFGVLMAVASSFLLTWVAGLGG